MISASLTSLYRPQDGASVERESAALAMTFEKTKIPLAGEVLNGSPWAPISVYLGFPFHFRNS